MKLSTASSLLALSFAVLIIFSSWTSVAFCQVVVEAPQDTSPNATSSPEAVVSSEEATEFPEELRTRAPETLAEVKLLEQRVQDLVDKVRPATISMFGGTGVVVGKEGYILSAGHVVVEPGRRIRIRFPDGRQAIAVTLGVDERYDSGMAKIVSDGDFPYLEMGTSSDLEQGQWCLAVGFPVSFSRSQKPPVRLGRILSNRSRSIVSDCTIMGGDSGGPLFDLDGKVIGINSRVSGSLNQNMHVPVDIFTRDWDSLTKDEVRNKAGRIKPSAAQRGYLGIRWSRGGTSPMVGQVMSGTAAEKAGMKSGDLIIQVAGKRTREIKDVTDQLSNLSAGDDVSVKIKRDEEEIKFDVTLGKRP